MLILKSKVYKENIGRARANFQIWLENVGHFDIDSVLRRICCHICFRADYVRVNTTPKTQYATFEEQVSVTFEFGDLKKYFELRVKFRLHFWGQSTIASHWNR